MGTGIYAVTGSETGVGRTTTALQLGMALERAGYNVVVADVDLEMAGLVEALGFRPGATIQDVLTRTASINDAIVDGPAGVTIVPADPDGADIDEEDPKLERVVEPLIAAHDVVLLDTPPELHPLNRAIIEYADGMVIVTTADSTAVETVEKLTRAADLLYTDVLGLVVTHTDDATAVANVVLELDQSAIAAIPESDVLADSPSRPDVEATVKDAYDQVGAVVGRHIETGERDDTQLAMTVSAAESGDVTLNRLISDDATDGGEGSDGRDEDDTGREGGRGIRNRLSGVGSRLGSLFGERGRDSRTDEHQDGANPLDELERDDE